MVFRYRNSPMVGIAGCAMIAAALASPRVPLLAPGATTSAFISDSLGGHFHVSLRAGEFVHTSINQLEQDLSVCLYGPDGALAATVDSFEYGRESLSHVARLNGLYRIDVKPVHATSGRFEIKVDWPRTPKPEDTTVIDAEQASTEGKALQQSGKPAELRQALSREEDAVRLWHLVGDQSAEARTLLKMGEIQYGSSAFDDARRKFERALAVARASDDRRTAAEARNGIGVSAMQLGDTEAAEREFRDALEDWRAIHHRFGAAASAENLGQLLWRCGEFESALRYHQQALVDFQKLQDPSALARAFNNLALTYSSMNKPQLALDYLEKAQRTFQKVREPAAHARTLINIGYVQFLLGNRLGAEHSERHALEILKGGSDKRARADALVNLGRTLESRSKDQAETLYAEAIDNYRAIGDRRGESGTLHLLGRIHGSSGQPGVALDELERAFRLRSDAGIRDAAADTLSEISRILESLGDLDAASRRLGDALALAESVRTRVPGEDFRVSYFVSKQSYYERYVELLMRLDRPAEAFEAAERARARALLELLASARQKIRVGVDPSLIAREVKLNRQLNLKSQQLIRLSRQPSDPSHASALRTEVDELLAEYHVVTAEIRQQNPRTSLMEPLPASLREVQESLRDDTALLEFFLGTTRSYLFVVTREGLETFALPSRSSIEKDAQAVAKLIGEARARDREPSLQRQFDLSLDRLTRVLLYHDGRFRSKRRWVVIPDGALQYVPFSALAMRTRAKWLQALPVISVIPSSSILRVLDGSEEHRATPAEKTVAVFADPVFNPLDPRLMTRAPLERGTLSQSAASSAVPVTPELARLPFSLTEVEAIAALVAPRDRFIATGPAATKQAFMAKNLSQFRILHLSTHAFLNDDYPEFSWVAFSQADGNGKPLDGLLRSYEIYSLSLPHVEMVVLSACRTGLGKEMRGEGLIGFTRGFLYAGASRVLVSLWEVEDQATAELMRRFYTKMLGSERLPAASALASAQASMRSERRWQDPYYWAGFILVSGQN